jgi:hypothetical protein
MIDVKGSIVTIDAMGCQTEIAKKINKKEADYILCLKENQKTLYENVKSIFERAEKINKSNIKKYCIVEKLKKLKITVVLKHRNKPWYRLVTLCFLNYVGLVLEE